MSELHQPALALGPQQNDDAGWRVIGASVRGAAHVRAHLPNQDAMHWLPASGSGLPLILTLADGHGSAKSFRSDVGAGLAVETATMVLHKLLCEPDASDGEWLHARLPHSLVDTWRRAVELHLADNPFTAEEWTKLSEKESAAARELVEANPWLAYGATLMTLAITDSQILFAQLGDGDVLIVSESGEVSRARWPRDERLFANETTSLCMNDAWQEVRVDIQATADHNPALILLATDGYANSFQAEDDFRKVGSDLLEMIRTDGLDAVNAHLPTWLDEASQLGSGDDITLGVVCHMHACADTTTVLQRRGFSDAVQDVAQPSQPNPQQTPMSSELKPQPLTDDVEVNP